MSARLRNGRQGKILKVWLNYHNNRVNIIGAVYLQLRSATPTADSPTSLTATLPEDSMNGDPPPSTADLGDSHRPIPTESLTRAQLEFALLLGRILADRWDREHPGHSGPAKDRPL